MIYVIDDRPFDPSRVDQRVVLGTIEEWTLVNSPMTVYDSHVLDHEDLGMMGVLEAS